MQALALLHKVHFGVGRLGYRDVVFFPGGTGNVVGMFACFCIAALFGSGSVTTFLVRLRLSCRMFFFFAGDR